MFVCWRAKRAFSEVDGKLYIYVCRIYVGIYIRNAD